MDNITWWMLNLTLTSDVEYFETPLEAEFGPNDIRKEVGTKLTFNVLIDRSGSFLFTNFGQEKKAFVISWLAIFSSPRKEFETRISLNLGTQYLGLLVTDTFVDSSLLIFRSRQSQT